MIINKSGITIRVKVSDFRIMGRATQGVKLIDLEKRNDSIGSVCKVTSQPEEEENDEETVLPGNAVDSADNDIISPEDENLTEDENLSDDENASDGDNSSDEVISPEE